MKQATYIHDSGTYTHTLAANVSVGDIVEVGTRIAVCAVDGIIGQDITLLRAGQFAVNAKTADAIAQGVTLFWDVANLEVTVTDTGVVAGEACTTKAGATAGTVWVEIA